VGDSPAMNWGSAAAVVSYVRLALTNGGSLRVNAVAVGGQKYFAFVLGNGQHVRRWTAYDAAGRQVATGTG